MIDDQAVLLIPDSVCSDSPSQAEGLTFGSTMPIPRQLGNWASWPGWCRRQCNWCGHFLGNHVVALSEVGEELGAYGRMRLDRDEDLAFVYLRVGFIRWIHDPGAAGIGFPYIDEKLIASHTLLLMEYDGLDVGVMLEVEVQGMDDWECPES